MTALTAVYLETRDEELYIEKMVLCSKEDFKEELKLLIESIGLETIPVLVKLMKAVYKTQLKEIVQNYLEQIMNGSEYQFFSKRGKLVSTLVDLCSCKKLPSEVARMAGLNYFRRTRNKWWLNL